MSRYTWVTGDQDESGIAVGRLAEQIAQRVGPLPNWSMEAARDAGLAEALATTSSVFNVMSYGADPTGTVDSQPAFQKAVDAALAIDGGVVYAQGGDYLIKSTITVGSNIWIRGDGEDTFLDFSTPTTAPDNLFEFIGTALDDLRISDMRIRGDSDNADLTKATSGVGIYIVSTTNQERTWIDHLRIERFRYGIYLRADIGQNEVPSVTNCFFDQCSQAGLRVVNSRKALVHGNIVDGDRTGIGDEVDGKLGFWMSPSVSGIVGHRHLRMVNNAAYNITTEGFNIVAQYATVVGNVVDTIGQTGILFEPMLRLSPTDSDAEMLSTITGNTVRNASTNGIAIRHDPVNNTRAAGRLVVANNNITGGVTGIRIGQGGASTQGVLDMSVSGNFCYDQSSKGIQLVDAENVTLSGNWCGSIGDAGLSVEGASKRIAITGGFYSANTTDSDSVKVADTSKYVIISGALISNADRAGVNISGSADFVLVTGNVFVDDQSVPTTNNAVRVSSSGTNIVTHGNLTDGMTAVEYSGSAAGLVKTLADDATPSVDGAENWKTGGTTTITDLDDGIVGDIKYILSAHAVTITDGTNILLNGSANFVMAAGDTLTLKMFNDQVWEETARKVNL